MSDLFHVGTSCKYSRQGQSCSTDYTLSLLLQISRARYPYLGPSLRAASALLCGLGPTTSLIWPWFHNRKMIRLD